MRCPARIGMYNRKPCLSMSAPWLHKSVPFDFTSVQKKNRHQVEQLDVDRVRTKQADGRRRRNTF